MLRLARASLARLAASALPALLSGGGAGATRHRAPALLPPLTGALCARSLVTCSAGAPGASTAALLLLAALRPAWKPPLMPTPAVLPASTPLVQPLRADSVKRKRIKKMNRHKKRKLIKRERNKNRGA